MIMNMPVSSDSTMIWDIDDYLEIDTRTVSTLPRDMTNGYVVKLNDTFYAIGGGKNSGNTLTAQKTYKYVDGEWVEDTVLGTVSAIRKWEGTYGTHRDVSYQCTGGVVSNGNMIYCTTYTYSNTKYAQAPIYKYDGVTKTNETNYFGYYDSGYCRYGTVGIAAAPSSYKTISMGDGCSYDYKINNANYGLNIGKTSTGSYKTLPNTAFTIADNSISGTEVIKVLQPLGQGTYYKNNYVFLVSQRVRHHNYHSTSSYIRNSYSYKYYLVFVNSNDVVVRTVELPDHISIVLGMVAIGDYIYVSYEYNTYRWSYRTNKWEILNLNGALSSLVEYDGEIHAFGNGTTHIAIKPYRKAKTYAPKGTKIYLPYETAATSTNLQPIEGGYVVTESGNVELKIYDY